ncbi:hypothetical protein [Microbispora sp. NPDC049125]
MNAQQFATPIVRGPRIRVHRKPRPSWERGGRSGARLYAIEESLGWR